MAEAMASGRTRMRPRERLLVFLGVCLPVPLFAATGLSLPLPGTVERIATRLVPFGERTALTSGGVAGGSIVLTDAERRQVNTQEVVVRVPAVVEPAAAPTARQLSQRLVEPRRARPSRSDDAQSSTARPRVTPEPAPVALPPLSPPGDASTPARGPKSKTRPAHEHKPRNEPVAKQKQKPKHEPPVKEKPHPAPPPKPEPKPELPRGKPPKVPADEPQPPRRGGAEEDNGEGDGKLSAPEHRQSP